MAEKQDTPEIRFEGFTDPWERRKLGELMDITSVRRVHQENWTNEGVRFLRARDLVAFAKNEPIDDPIFISQEMYQEYSAQSGKVSMGDLLVTGVGTIGVPWLVTSENPIYFKDGNIIWFKNAGKIDGEFFYHSFVAGTIQSFISEAAGIGTVGTYTIETGKKTPIWLPAKQEQCCVSASMTCLDNLIALHQRKYETLRAVKDSMLDKMFPKEGETEPELRFDGFTDPWEQRKFSDVAVIRRGLTYSPTNIVDGADGVRVLRSSNINEDHFVLNDDDVFVDESAVNIDLVHDGDILITAANGSPRLVGKRARISDLPGKTVHGGFMLVASSPCSDFLCASMGSSWYRRFLATGVAGGNGAIGNLDSKALGETTIAVPNDAEIDKLGNFFTRLDSLITLHRRKCETLRAVKAAMLDKMFPKGA